MISNTDVGEIIGVSTHGNVMGLFLNSIDPTAGIGEAEKLKNPDVLKILIDGDGITWDRGFELPGLAQIATDHLKTPMDKRL